MRIRWLFFSTFDLDDGGSYMIPTQSHLYPSSYLNIPGTVALRGVFSCISKLAGALLFCVSGGSNSSLGRGLSDNPHGSKNSPSFAQFKHMSCSSELVKLQFDYRATAESAAPLLFHNIVSTTLRHLRKEVEQLQSFPFLSLAAAFVPPFDNISPNVLAVPLKGIAEHLNANSRQSPCADQHQGCASLSLSEINWMRDAVEPKTGIKFPTVLDNALAGEDSSALASEVLVGTGSRSMRVIKIKTLKVYAFGLYIHPDSVCEKLGPKYASVPASELNNRSEFFEDLLREDIHMTVRLVVNFNGLRINTVRDAFEKSLRARLLKVNPETDYHCLNAFDSYFTQDIPLPAGTTIDFRQTADGRLITEIGGQHMGAIHSKDLCRAFFDMYIGDVPVSVQAKEEIASNVARIMRRC